jgi:release factor glutamine methyltransferase
MKHKESTIRALIDEGENSLSESPHPERARRDAETLLLYVLRENAQDENNAWATQFGITRDMNKAWLVTNGNLSILPRLYETYKSLIKRRCAGEPIQYIMGETEFYGLSFRVMPDVLIPRPETEHLVEKVLELAAQAQDAGAKAHDDFSALPARLKSCPDTETRRSLVFKDPRILDVGTGSGAIAVSIAHDWPEAEITAIDLSPAALEVARGNAKRLGFADRIRFLEGDLLSPVAGERFEIVVSNPPYVPSGDRASLSVEVREYEPALALFAGDDGLDVYRRLIPAAFDALVPGGFVALEIGYGQSPAITELLACAGFEQIEFVPDLQNIPRVACARRPCASP